MKNKQHMFQEINISINVDFEFEFKFQVRHYCKIIDKRENPFGMVKINDDIHYIINR